MTPHTWLAIPNRQMLDGLQAYYERGEPPSAFAYAILSNNFVRACGHADEMNRLILSAWASWLMVEVDERCWGSAEKVDRWVAQRGLQGADPVAYMKSVAMEAEADATPEHP